MRIKAIVTVMLMLTITFSNVVFSEEEPIQTFEPTSSDRSFFMPTQPQRVQAEDIPTFETMDGAGWEYPSSTCWRNEWSGRTNCYRSSGYARSGWDGEQGYDNFGFNIPDDAVVTGIKIRVRTRAYADDERLYLRLGSSAGYTDCSTPCSGSSYCYSNYEVIYHYQGGWSETKTLNWDMSNEGWKGSDINGDNLKVRCRALHEIEEIYYILAYVYYEPPAVEMGDESIADGSTEISGFLSNWSVNINLNTDSCSGTIECSNGDSTSWTDEGEGRKTLAFSEWLEYNTTHTIWVNVTAGGENFNEIYTFTTTTCKITGRISEDLWGGVPDVQVVANNTNVEYTTYTDADGYYEFDDVEYGTDIDYNITAGKFAYEFYADDGKQYIVENLERNVSGVNFTGVHYFFGGTGTIEDPFTIKNATHLDNIRLFKNHSFVVYNDINMSAENVEEWKDGKGFEPIGNETTPFNGNFDGGGYVISNLHSDYDEEHVGLFGYVQDSDIRNLGLKQSNITGGNYTGSLIGYANNTSISKTFTYSTKKVEGNQYAGGLIGFFSNGTIKNAYARVNTTGTTYGGLIGESIDSTINLTYATGDVTGGGGLIDIQTNSDIKNSYFDNQTSGTTISDGGTGKNTDDMTSQSFWDTTNFSFPDIWFLDENQNDNYPILSIYTEITPPLLREVNRAGSLTQQIHRYLNSSFNPEDYCFFNVTAFVPPERYIGHWNKNVSDQYFIATADRTHEPDYNDTEQNYVVASRFDCDYTGYYEQIRIFTIWHGMYPAHLGAAVCADDNGEPGEVLGYTEAYTIQEGRDEIWFPDTSHVWISLNLTNPVFMAKDTQYWLVATSNDSSMWRESKYGDYNLSTYSDFAWLLGRADGESTDNVKRLAYNVTLDIPDKEYVDPYEGTGWAGMYGYWKGDVQNASFNWPSSFEGNSWQQGVDSMTTELDESATPVPLTDLLIYATTTVDVSPVNITQVEVTWGKGGTEDNVWEEPSNMTRVSPNMDYWEYNKTGIDGGEWNTWKITLYDEFGNVESYDYYRWLKHGQTERIVFQANVSSPGAGDDYKEITNETDLYSQEYVMYPYEAQYDDTMYIYGDNEGRKQVLRHEQGVDGSSTDTGYWRMEEPTDEYHERTCAFFVGSVFDENVVIPDEVTIDNAVMVWWQASGRQVEGAYWAPPYNDVGTNFHWGRSDIESSFDEFYIDDLGYGEWESYKYDALNDTIAWQTFPDTRRYLNDWINFEEDTWYGDDTPYMDNSTGRLTNYMGRQVVGKADFTSLAGTDYPNTFDSNSIYQLFMGIDYDAMWASGSNAAVFNNRSHPSFIIFNVPDDETLKTKDSNNDGINDYEALYKYGLHPFWDDTDNDGFTDIQEISRGTGANLYRDYPSDSNIIYIKNVTPMKDSTEDWSTTLSVEVENPNELDMNITWHALRNFTFNNSYSNQDHLLEGEWEVVQTNQSVPDGVYTMDYEPAAGNNYIAVNVTNPDGWYSNRTLTFSGPDRQINGTVTYNGQEMQDVIVTATINGDVYYDYTDSDGKYLIENLTGGDYVVEASYGDYYFVPENETVSISTENKTVDFEAFNGISFISENPQNETWPVDTSLNWSISIEHDYKFNWTIECSDGNSSSGTNENTGRKHLLLSNLDYGKTYTVWVNASNYQHAHIRTNQTYNFKVKESSTVYPGEPIDFTATTRSDSQIDLSWETGSDASYTHIRYYEGSTPPPNPESGTFAYEDDGTSISIYDLNADTQYSFSAWSYNSSYGSWSFSSTDSATTQSEFTPSDDKIFVTLDPQTTANISINKTTWSPTANIGESETTGLSHFNLENIGNVQVDVYVNTSNTADWISASSPAHNQFNLNYNKGSGWTMINTTSSIFSTDIAYNEDVDFGLQLYMPTSSSTNTNQQSTITFTAIMD